MADKTEKRTEMIKRYNKNISDEELEKKLKSMEDSEEYTKDNDKKGKFTGKWNRINKINKIRIVSGVISLVTILAFCVVVFLLGERTTNIGEGDGILPAILSIPMIVSILIFSISLDHKDFLIKIERFICFIFICSLILIVYILISVFLGGISLL